VICTIKTLIKKNCHGGGFCFSGTLTKLTVGFSLESCSTYDAICLHCSLHIVLNCTTAIPVVVQKPWGGGGITTVTEQSQQD
jgi:hypothetical protein